MKSNSIITRISSVSTKRYFSFAVIGLGMLAVFAAGDASAMTWPPTAADVTDLLGDVALVIGGLIAAAVTAGLVLYGGWQGLMAALGAFSKLVSKSFGR